VRIGDARTNPEYKPHNKVRCCIRGYRTFWASPVSTGDDGVRVALMRIFGWFDFRKKWWPLPQKQRRTGL
jgi:hypothetical protein